MADPIYAQTEPSEPIDLAVLNVGWSHEGTKHQALATVSMRFAPDVRLQFVASTRNDAIAFAHDAKSGGGWDGELTVLDAGVTIDAILIGAKTSSRSNGTSHSTLAFGPKRSVVTPTQPCDCLTKVTFHVFNFPEFLGETDYFITRQADTQTGRTRCGRVLLQAEGWDITIAATDMTKDSCDLLREQGGFIITHVGTIERTDRSAFTSEHLQDLLICLHSFLSLALGRWAGLALPVGFDSNGTKQFEQWGMPLAARGAWSGSCSWFDAQHSELLTQVFPKFYVLWRDPTWRPAIHAALYWYLAANDRTAGIGVDAALILAQTALERLAWTYLVLDRKMLSAWAAKRLPAADRLRLFASALDIPAEVPSQLTALHAKHGDKWADVPDVITRIRNLLVHPSDTAQPSDGSCFAAWKLSTWLLDLTFLRLCGHGGRYSNRIAKQAVGEVEPVPWIERRQ